MNSSSSYETKTETISFMHHNFYVCCYELYGILSALCDRSKETLSVPSCRRIICCSIFTQDKLGRRTFPRQSSPAGLPYSLLKQTGFQVPFSLLGHELRENPPPVSSVTLVRIFEASSVFHLVSLQHIKVKSRAVYFLVALLASLQSYLAEDLSRTRCVYFYAAPAAFDLCNADGFCQLGLQFQKQSSVFLD